MQRVRVFDGPVVAFAINQIKLNQSIEGWQVAGVSPGETALAILAELVGQAVHGDDKALPSVGLGATTANAKVNVLILTPKVGIRLLDEPKIKCDFLTGFRYWRFGQNLSFSPSVLNLNFSDSQSWVDPLVGGRIESPLSSKLVATVFGDVGGWGTGSQLEYQVGGVLGYKVKETVTLQAGYRYLYVNYRGGGIRRPVFDTHLSGVVLGATFNLK